MLRVGEIAKEFLETVDELYDALTDQHDLRTSGQYGKLLTDIFTSLKDNARVREVNIDVCSDFQWDGLRQDKPWCRNLRIYQELKRHDARFTDPLLEVQFGFASPGIDYYDDRRKIQGVQDYFPFALVMQALHQSDLRAKDLASAANTWLWTLDIDKVLQDPDTFVARQAIFTNLEHLAVGISHSDDACDFGTADNDIESFAGLLASASNLVSLTLCTGYSSILYNVVAKAVFPSLCALKLRKASTPLADLHTIVQGLVERNSALQQLHLHGVVLLHCESFVNEADNENGGAGTVADFSRGYSWAKEENLLGNALRKLLGLSGESIEVKFVLGDLFS